MIFVILYLVVAALLVLPVARVILVGDTLRLAADREPDAEDMALAATLGVCGALVWPFTLLVFLIVKALKKEVRK